MTRRPEVTFVTAGESLFLIRKKNCASQEARIFILAVRFQNRHHQSETWFSTQKTQNLASEMRLKTASLGRYSDSEFAPDIVEAILAGIEPDGLSIAKLTEQPIQED